MTRTEYVKKLAELYYLANMSDTEDKPDWMTGDESAVHCQAFDQIVRHMGLSDIWGNILEGDCLDQVEPEPHLDTAKVGDGLTEVGYTDRKACTIVARTATTILYQRDKATLLNGANSGEADALVCHPGGFAAHVEGTQRYHIERDPNAGVQKATRRVLKDGTVVWKRSGWPTRSPGGQVVPGRHEFYDFNF